MLLMIVFYSAQKSSVLQVALEGAHLVSQLWWRIVALNLPEVYLNNIIPILHKKGLLIAIDTLVLQR
jgi:hypothetical protein